MRTTCAPSVHRIEFGTPQELLQTRMGLPTEGEIGDHRSLVHVTGDDFGALMKDARRGRFSHHV